MLHFLVDDFISFSLLIRLLSAASILFTSAVHRFTPFRIHKLYYWYWREFELFSSRLATGPCRIKVWVSLQRRRKSSVLASRMCSWAWQMQLTSYTPSIRFTISGSISSRTGTQNSHWLTTELGMNEPEFNTSFKMLRCLPASKSKMESVHAMMLSMRNGRSKFYFHFFLVLLILNFNFGWLKSELTSIFSGDHPVIGCTNDFWFTRV